MSATTTLNKPFEPLLRWLETQHVEYEVHEHNEAFTARATATAEGIDPRTFAKVVGIATSDGRNILVLLEATDQLDLDKVAHALSVSAVQLLSEAELAALAPGCEVGAIPAVGTLFGLATCADHAMRDDPEVSFNAGSHRFSVRVERATWERACGAIYGDLVVARDAAPAWARS